MQPRRMGGLVNLLELANRYLGVDLRGGEVGVAQHLLDESYVGSVLQHQCGHGVAEEMARPGFVDVGLGDVVPNDSAQSLS